MSSQTWTPAPKKGIIPLHPLTFGMLLSKSFVALRHNPKVLFGFGVVIQLAVVVLASKPQQVFSREMLLEQVWGYHYKADTRLVNVHVQRLRAKVELDPDNPKIVMTVRGVGYRAGGAG